MKNLKSRAGYITTALALFAALLLILPAVVYAAEEKSAEPAAGEEINWQVISGGGTRATSATMVLNGTLGQNAVGVGSSPSYGLIAGFWQDFDGGGCCVVPGDVDHSGVFDISDITYYVDWMFGGGPPPPCEEEADADGSGVLDISDLTYLVAYMFDGGPPPVPCP